MPRPEVLERIKTAESDADDIVAEAEADREERIAEARRKAEEIRQRTGREAMRARSDSRMVSSCDAPLERGSRLA